MRILFNYCLQLIKSPPSVKKISIRGICVCMKPTFSFRSCTHMNINIKDFTFRASFTNSIVKIEIVSLLTVYTFFCNLIIELRAHIPICTFFKLLIPINNSISIPIICYPLVIREVCESIWFRRASVQILIVIIASSTRFIC